MPEKICTDIREKFSDYIDEFLSETEMADLEMHLKRCPSCQKELEQLNKTVQALRNLPRYTMHPGIIVKINDRIAKNRRWWQKLPLGGSGMKKALGTISALVICLIGYQVYTRNDVTGLMKAEKVSTEEKQAHKEVAGKARASNVGKSKDMLGASAAPVSHMKPGAKAPERKNQEAAKIFEEADAAKDGKADKSSITTGMFRNAPKDRALGSRMEISSLEKEKSIDSVSSEFKRKMKQGAPLALQDEAKSENVLRMSEGATLAFDNEQLTVYEHKGLFCKNSIKENVIIKDTSALKKLWEKHFADLPLPSVDFKKKIIVVVFLGEQTGEAKDISFKEAAAEGGKYKVKFSVTPILNTDTSGGALSPYYIRELDKNTLPIEVVLE